MLVNDRVQSLIYDLSSSIPKMTCDEVSSSAGITGIIAIPESTNAIDPVGEISAVRCESLAGENLPH